jgi:RNA polymerase sigma factor (sigma-70 family)
MLSPHQQRMVAAVLPLTKRLAQRYSRYLPLTAETDDLEGYLHWGLLRAAQLYDPKHGVPFTHYATLRSLLVLRCALRDEWRHVRSRKDQERLGFLRKRFREESLCRKRPLTREEEAEIAGLDPFEYDDLRCRLAPRSIDSLDRKVCRKGGEQGLPSTVGDFVADTEAAGWEDRCLDRIVARQALSVLDEYDREIVWRHAGQGEPFSQIARDMGHQEQSVRKWYRAALKRVQAEAARLSGEAN